MLKKIIFGLFYCLTISMFSQSITEGFTADYFQPSKKNQYGIIVLGGAEGGKPNELSKMFVENGYAVLSLAYFKEENVPEELEMIPLEYFEKPKQWLMRQKDVNASGVVIVGWSKGAELSLVLASTDPEIKGVVSISPSSVVWGGILKDWKKVPKSSWSLDGKPLPHVSFDTSGKAKTLVDLYLNSLNNKELVKNASIKIEESKAKILLLSGSKDEIWPAFTMSKVLIGRFDRLRNNQCKHINYPSLGHLLDEKFFIKEKGKEHSSRKEIFSFLKKLNDR